MFGETELGPQRPFHEELVIDTTRVGPALDLATLAVPVRSVVAEAEQVGIDATPRRSDSITLVCLANDLARKNLKPRCLGRTLRQFDLEKAGHGYRHIAP